MRKAGKPLESEVSLTQVSGIDSIHAMVLKTKKQGFLIIFYGLKI